MLIELFLLMILITVVVLSIRCGKSGVLDKPVIVNRPGQYHITLAPQLERAQTFIEQIAARFALSDPPQADLPGQYFEVREPGAPAQGGSFYLLAAAYCDGLLYFQAINPQSLLRDSDSHVKQIRGFSEAVLEMHPLQNLAAGEETDKLCSAVETAAQQMNVNVKVLTEVK